MGDEKSEVKRVLLVEDDADLREVLSEVLSAAGYEVVARANGQEGLDYLRSEKAPRVVLLDLMMPIKSGYEFVHEKNADPLIAGIPVIAMSATNELAKKAAQLRVAGVLAKPVEIDALLGTVERFFVS